jgi:hypothetical protein
MGTDTWTVAEAKAKFSEVIDRARSKGQLSRRKIRHFDSPGVSVPTPSLWRVSENSLAVRFRFPLVREAAYPNVSVRLHYLFSFMIIARTH